MAPMTDERRDAEPTVTVVIVNFRTPALTLRCVESVRASTGVSTHVIVLDNDSGDDSAHTLAGVLSARPGVEFHARPVNDGFAGGANAGLALARARGARWVLLLNSDATVTPDCVRRLVDEGEREVRCALVNPRIMLGSGGDRLWFGGARFSLWTARPVHVGLHRAAAHGWREPRDAPFATGCAMLVRLDAVAGEVLDASLFGYAEDLDLSLRLRRDGWRIRFVPDAVVWHDAGASHRRAGGEALRFYLSTRNLLRVVSRHARWFHWPVLAPMFAVNVVGRYVVASARRGDWHACVAVCRGAWHAVTGGRHPIERGETSEPRAR
jgi:GT2 family glycosyltransferase